MTKQEHINGYEKVLFSFLREAEAKYGVKLSVKELPDVKIFIKAGKAHELVSDTRKMGASGLDGTLITWDEISRTYQLEVVGKEKDRFIDAVSKIKLLWISLMNEDFGWYLIKTRRGFGVKLMKGMVIFIPVQEHEG